MLIFYILFNQLLYSIDCAPAKASAALQSDGVKPELADTAVALYVDMRRLVAIPGIKEKSVRTNS